ncbi:MAG TPA: NifU family protein [Candidatus Omnitrophota bacterium]|nr:NifU family protein [Candidatus Omnitrophota bacterium]HPD85379.1 NifU family protein [Candidatus Omnitrophota bacterium]HRZ04120.1 NifU family protein [Candidatus Omnitrophota bacterium]
MENRIQIQATPNPNALKFILDVPVKNQGKAIFKSAEDCHHCPLARHLFTVPHVTELYFFGNFITVTQDGHEDWEILEEKIKKAILEKIAEHDANFDIGKQEEKIPPATEKLSQVESILDQTIRPALQGDGGDVQVVSFENNVLTVHYQGACGSCPSATMGTLKAIEAILKEEYDPNIVVQAL